MSFLSFNKKYFTAFLDEAEKAPSSEIIYEAKQLLKLLDDLEDEGYTRLNEYLEASGKIVTRLKKTISDYNEKPFEAPRFRLSDVEYTKEEYELCGFTEELILRAKVTGEYSANPFLKDVFKFCEWLDYAPDTAYVFLFRDALLPYVYFKTRGREHLYPWLIGRRFLENVTSQKNVDDEIRLAIYDALEEGAEDINVFREFCKVKILTVLERYPYLKRVLSELLASVKEEKIQVIESGYCGTIPMLLAALDERVDFKMFTTAPYLYGVYRDKIFCKRYEELRNFETLYSQDKLIRLSDFRDGKFYVNKADGNVNQKTLSEIKFFTDKFHI